MKLNRLIPKFKFKILNNYQILFGNNIFFMFQTVGDDLIEQTLSLMPDMISKASLVHNRVNTLFSDNAILNIP